MNVKYFIPICAFFFAYIAVAFDAKSPNLTASIFATANRDDFKLSIKRYDTNFAPINGYCYAQARMAFAPDGRGIFAMQGLALKGSDVYSGLFFAQSKDGGKTWGKFTKSRTIKRTKIDGDKESMLIDASPFFHRKSGKFVIIGANLNYKGDKFVPPHSVAYSVFDAENGDWSQPRILQLPYSSCSAGSVQLLENPDGSILLPISNDENKVKSARVLKCEFDGTLLKCVQIGAPLTVPQPRGLYEPSIIKSGDFYYLSLRNDITGYIAKSSDGLKFDTPRPLEFDDLTNVGNYNTQTHWIENDGKVYLVYTRKGANNDHVFRHRAPLFMAQLDTKNMNLKKSTEIAVVPERGARLGNFGCAKIADGIWTIVAAEWMQGDKGYKGCMEHGSNNSIFSTQINFYKK